MFFEFVWCELEFWYLFFEVGFGVVFVDVEWDDFVDWDFVVWGVYVSLLNGSVVVGVFGWCDSVFEEDFGGVGFIMNCYVFGGSVWFEFCF